MTQEVRWSKLVGDCYCNLSKREFDGEKQTFNDGNDDRYGTKEIKSKMGI